MSAFQQMAFGGIRYPVFGGDQLQIPPEIQQLASFRQKVQWAVAYRGVDPRWYIPTDISPSDSTYAICHLCTACSGGKVVEIKLGKKSEDRHLASKMHVLHLQNKLHIDAATFHPTVVSCAHCDMQFSGERMDSLRRHEKQCHPAQFANSQAHDQVTNYFAMPIPHAASTSSTLAYAQSPLPSPVTSPISSALPSPQSFNGDVELFGIGTWMDSYPETGIDADMDIYELDAAVCEALRQTGHLPASATTTNVFSYAQPAPVSFSGNSWSDYTSF